MHKYKCLVLDHDDTVVKSTPQIHYPAFMETLNKLRPEYKLTLEEFVMYNFEPGFLEMCYDIFGFTQEEMKLQEEHWIKKVNKKIPTFYEGIGETIKKFKADGGIICVVSHSFSKIIVRDYVSNINFEPDMTFGWEYENDKRKPNPFPLQEIMRKYNLQPRDLLMVDDLKPGYDMAKKCGVDFAYAGWSCNINKIRQFMKQYSDFYFEDVASFDEFLYKK
ncbi:HAD family hydrolase [Sedimentibacter sp. zth1]|uniref:HAD family hydrolase n=1 Tax=Sedimentibacter sp. zth1 TaxID=2816908 RepID=UPI001A927B8A|nr:HAD hydrolase-like protein [Sedimentibacter sp. zth1]QSX06500.1 HAD family hydrolase [Sedimentibacter sp. zth1]